MELEIRGLGKRYGQKAAVSGVELTITPGVWGLIGANGAGKTTLMRMLAGILPPSAGRVLYDGVDIRDLGEAYRDALGYLPQSFGFYPEFTVTDYLEYIAALKGVGRREGRERMEALLELLSLAEVRKKKIKKLSGGMQRRVGIAQAMLNDPDVLIMDGRPRPRRAGALPELSRGICAGADRAHLHPHRLGRRVHRGAERDNEGGAAHLLRQDGGAARGRRGQGVHCGDWAGRAAAL